MSETHPAATNLLGRTATLAAPLALLIGSTCYFTGNIYHKKLFAEFGLNGSTVQPTLQAVIAQGYVVILFVLAISTLVSLLITGTLLSFGKGRRAVRATGRAVSRPRNFAHIAIWVYLAFGAAGLGYLSAHLGAGYTALIIRSQINDQCRTCYLYNTTRGRVVAVPLAQDEKTTLLVTRRGAVLLPAGSIKAVRRIWIPRGSYLNGTALKWLGY